MSRRFGVGAGLMLFAACGDLDLPPGCQDILTTRSDEARCTTELRCAQVRNDPTLVVRWDLRIGEYWQDAAGDDLPYSSAEMSKRRNCVGDYLDNRGVTLLDRGSETSPFVVAEGIAANFDAILDFSPVEAYSLSCAGGTCEHCSALDESTCISDSFCWAVSARPYDPDGTCLAASSFSHCQSGDQSCGDAETWARDPQGDCWLFASTCIPDQFEARTQACAGAVTDPSDCP